MGKKQKYTIGLITNNMIDYYSRQITLGVVNKCKELDLNILIFTGTLFTVEDLYLNNNNIIYKLIHEDNIDGLIINSGILGNYIAEEKLNSFIQQFKNIPRVSISKIFPDIPSILIDNKAGLTQLIDHLILEHKKIKIAFVSGPKNNSDSIERYNTYKACLKKNKIAFDPNIVVAGDFTTSTYTKNKIIKLINKKKNKIIDFDTIICANDEMALAAYDILNGYNLSVPDDIIVTGFDNNSFSKFTHPPLTTIAQPLDEIGRKSAEVIFQMLKGNNFEYLYKFPTNTIIRESCGCNQTKFVKQITQLKYPVEGICELSEIKKVLKSEILKSFSQNNYLYNLTNKEHAEQINNIIKVILDDVIDSQDQFQYYLRDIIAIQSKNMPITEIIINIINIIQGILEKIVKQIDLYKKINKNLHNIQTKLLNEVEFFYNQAIDDQYTCMLISSLTEFDTSLRLENLIEKLNAIVPRLYFEVFFLAAYARDEKSNSNQLNLFNFNELPTVYSKKIYSYVKGEENKNESNSIFKTFKLFPDEFKEKLNKKNCPLIVLPIFFGINHFGYICHNLIKSNELSYNLFLLFIKSTLKSISLVNEIESTKKELTKSNEKLKELDNLKNDFIANITHDFKSPLTAIINLADLGRKTIDENDNDNKENYELIYNAGFKLNKSINKLLEIAKMEAGSVDLNIEKVELIKFLNSIINFYSSSVTGMNIKIINKFPQKKITDFYTDTEKLEEIINNIISNALKFVNPNSGKITISIEETEKTVIIKIADNGIGIKKDKLELIFNRFEQASGGRNSIYQGTGIGLAFSKQLVEFLKGKIWADSNGIGKGSVFFLEFQKGKNIFPKPNLIKIPGKKKNYINKMISDKNIENIKNKINKQIIPYKVGTNLVDLNKENEFEIRKAKLLIVDDDPNIRKIVVKYLEKNKFKNFITAQDGKMALDAVYEYFPDIIICDYNMPRLRGDKFHDELINNPRYEKIPFIFLSAVKDIKIISKARKKGAQAYLTKPINEDELIITINQNLKTYFEYLKIYKLATYDDLVKIYNKREIIRILKNEIVKRKCPDISLIFFDLDLFKTYNDSYGHQLGDEILKNIGNLLNKSLRKYDSAGRFGGDEFIIILPDTNISQAKYVAEQTRKFISNLGIKFKEKSIKLTASFGVASLIDNKEYICKKLNINSLELLYNIDDPQHTNWDFIESKKEQIIDILLEISDIALYQAKSSTCKICKHTFITTKNKCPRCKSPDILEGRNKVIAFK